MINIEAESNMKYIWENYRYPFIIFLVLCLTVNILLVVGIKNGLKDMSAKSEIKRPVEMVESIPTLAFGFLKEKKVNVVTRYSEFNGAILCDYDETTLLILFQNKLFYLNRQQVVWVVEVK